MCSGPHHGSWTWFEASIIRPHDTQLPRWTKGIKSRPICLNSLEAEDSTLTDAAMVGPSPKRWFIHCNRTADNKLTQRTTVWSIHDEDSIADDFLLRGRVGRGREFLSYLEPGDRIALLARARVCVALAVGSSSVKSRPMLSFLGGRIKCKMRLWKSCIPYNATMHLIFPLVSITTGQAEGLWNVHTV